MKNPKKWLQQEVELWINQGIIDNQQARQITALYPQQTETNWGKLIFAGIGAVIFGLGIILVFAYNWESMHRFSKLSAVLLSVATAHTIGFYYSRDHSAHQRIGESLHLLGTMLFGAGIWLVAQIYHINEHYPNAFFIWSVGAIIIAWALPSLSHTLLALCLVTLWHWFEVFEFHSVNINATWLVLLGLLPLTVYLRSLSALFLTCCLLIFTYSTSYFLIADNNEETLFNVMLALSGSMIIGSYIAAKSNFSQSQNVIRIIGVGVFSVLLFIVSFDEIDSLYFREPLSSVNNSTWFYFFLPTVLFSINLMALLLRKSNTLKDNSERIELILVSTAILITTLSAFPSLGFYQHVWIVFSIIFLAYSILLIYSGARYLRWQSTTLGGLMLSAYTFARFLDLFDSLLLRGVAFLIIGTMLFGIGLYYSRQKQLAEQREGKQNDQ